MYVSGTRGLAAILVASALLVAGSSAGVAAGFGVSAVSAQPRMSRAEVRRAAVVIMANNARRLGRRLARPEVVSLTLVKPRQFHAGRTESVLWWSVEVRGTLLSCGATTCGIASRGDIAIADATGRELGGHLGGRVTIVSVSSVKQH